MLPSKCICHIESSSSSVSSCLRSPSSRRHRNSAKAYASSSMRLSRWITTPSSFSSIFSVMNSVLADDCTCLSSSLVSPSPASIRVILAPTLLAFVDFQSVEVFVSLVNLRRDSETQRHTSHLPRRYLAFENLLHLFERPPLQLGQAEVTPDDTAECEGREDKPDLRPQPRVGLVEQIRCREHGEEIHDGGERHADERGLVAEPRVRDFRDHECAPEME